MKFENTLNPYCVPLLDRHKGNLGMRSRTCDAIDKGAQMNLIYMGALGVGHATYP